MSINIKKRQWIIPLIALISSTVIIILVYDIAYSNLGIQHLPVGWDTPNYVDTIQLVKDGGAMQVLQKYDYVNFMYYLIASLIPYPPIITEIYFPIFLAICVIVSVGVFTKVLTNDIISISAAMLFTSVWNGLYRITSDLHADLLSIPLIFIAFYLFIENENLGANGNRIDNSAIRNSNPPIGRTSAIFRQLSSTKGIGIRWPSSIKKILIATILIISSLTHFENTIFLIIVLSLATILMKRLSNLKNLTFYVIIPILPSLLLYILHNFNSVYFPPGLRITHNPIPYALFLDFMGQFWPLVVGGTIASFLLLYSKNDEKRQIGQFRFFILFTLVWLVLSLIIFRLDYYDHRFFAFSYRAVVFLPIPFLATIPFLLTRLPRFKKLRTSLAIYAMTFSIIGAFTFLNLNYSVLQGAIPSYNISYLSDDAYLSLKSLKTLHFLMKPIFVFYINDPDLSTGGMSEYPNRWISALYGAHYKYLGFVNNLIDANETRFNDVSSKYYSYTYILEMKKNGIWNTTDIRKHPIIIIRDFYNVESMEINPHFRHVVSGIYEFQQGSSPKTIYRISALRTSNPIGWDVVNRTVNDTSYPMLETYVFAADKKIFNFTSPTEPYSCYSIIMKYIDGSIGLGFDIASHDKILSTIYYQNPGKLKETTISYCSTDKSSYFSIIPISKPNIIPERFFVSVVDNLEFDKIE